MATNLSLFDSNSRLFLADGGWDGVVGGAKLGSAHKPPWFPVAARSDRAVGKPCQASAAPSTCPVAERLDLGASAR